MNITTRAISNTYTKDFSIAKQVALGISDWEACDDEGRVAYGHSEQEAVENLMKSQACSVSAAYKRAMGI